MSELTQESAGPRSSLRHVLAILGIIAVPAGGILLQRSGLANSLVESAIHRPIMRRTAAGLHRSSDRRT